MPILPSVHRALTDRLRRAGCVYAEEEARILLDRASDAGELELLVQRRVSGVPLEHVVGWAGFDGRRVLVAPSVFVPRRRTELLVDLACENLPPSAVVVDLCCGSGAIAAAIAARRPDAEIHATDIDADAVACARRNLSGPGCRVWQGDLLDGLPSDLLGRVSVVVANAPYVPTSGLGLMPGEARQYEKQLSLDGGPDGLDPHRRIIGDLRRWLTPRGTFIVEVSQRQTGALQSLLRLHGFRAHVAEDEHRDATALVSNPRRADDGGDRQ